MSKQREALRRANQRAAFVRAAALTAVASLAAAALWVGCKKKDEVVTAPPPSTPVATAGTVTAAAGTTVAVEQATGNASAAPLQGPGAVAGGGGEGGLANPEITNDEFIDASEHRDPFVPFVQEKRLEQATVTPTTQPLPVAPVVPTQAVIFPDRELKDLQCRMILAMGGEKPRAYLTGPEGEHAYVTQGAYVGRPVAGGEGRSDTHWRVYEIEEGGVSFELSNVAAQSEDTGVRPAIRLYTEEEMVQFDRLFSLR
jgi:hypothetical protein